MFFRDQSGSTAVFTALAMPVLLGMVSLVVDVSHLRFNKTKLQLAADAGALAAVKNMSTAEAIRLAQANVPANYGQVTQDALKDVKFGTYDTVNKLFVEGPNGNAVQVTAARDAAHGNMIQGFFTRFLSDSANFEARAQSVAVRTGMTGCVYGLASSGIGFSVGSNTAVQASCGVRVNASTSGSSSNFRGSLCAAGTNTLTTDARCEVSRDPIGLVVDRNDFAPANIRSGNQKLAGTLAAGVYYFENASVSVTSDLTGSGVTLVLSANSTIDFRGNGRINLTPPTSGKYQGMVLVNQGSTMTLNGTSDMALNGMIYAPNTNINFSGTNGTAQYGTVVANTITFGGTSGTTFGAFPDPVKVPASGVLNKLVM